MQVLYVEDDPLDADLTRRELLKAAPHLQLEIAGSLRQAAACLERARYDVVLADMNLPDGEGLTLLTNIRRQELSSAVVLITGAADEEMAVTALKAGADDYVVKRADYRAHLAATLTSALEHFRAETARRAQTLHLLYAEDNALDIDLTRRHLARHAPHIQLQVANSATRALELLQTPGQHYDVLMLDYRLPGMTAIELLKELRRRPDQDIPVLLVTGQGNEEIAMQALRLGASDYIVKMADYLYRLPTAVENAFHRAQVAREQAALRESEARYRIISGLTSDFMYAVRIEPDGKLTTEWSNGAFDRITGYAWEEFLASQGWLHIVHPDDLAVVLEHAARVFAGQSSMAEFRVIDRHGGIHWTRDYEQPVWDEAQQRVIRTYGAAQDITEDRQKETQLRLQSTALEAAANGMVITDLNGIVQWANPAFTQLTGYAVDEIVGRKLDVIQSGQHDAAFYRSMWETIRAGRVWHDEIINRRKDGRLYTEEMTITPVRAAGGDITHFIAIKQDITARKQAEDKIRTLNRDLELRARELDALNQAGRVLYSTLNQERVLQLVLDQVRLLLNAAEASVLLRDPTSDDLIFAASSGDHAKALKGTRMPMTQGIAGWVVKERQPIIIADPQNDPRFYSGIDARIACATRSLLAVPLTFKGALWGVIEAVNKAEGVFDEHDQGLLEALASSAAIAIENSRLVASLQDANAQLQAALQAKEEMIQNVSHELRTPLGLIYGYIELLELEELGQLAPAQVKALHIMRQQGDRLRFMVERLLLMQTFEPEKLIRTQVDLNVWLNQAVQAWEVRAKRAGIQLDLEQTSGLPPVYADADYVGHVMENLLDNAFKFSPRNSTVKISARPDGHQVVIAVADQGVGIAPEKLDKVFERFYQVDGSATRRFGGMGIGLALCRAIVRAHGGEIWAESNGVGYNGVGYNGAGHGSAFCFTLPIFTSIEPGSAA